jgi:hypothetical protein
MNNPAPLTWYKLEIKRLESQKKLYRQLRKKLAWLRFVSLLLAIVIPIYLFSFTVFPAILSFIILLTLFLYFVLQDIKNNERIASTEQLLAINEREIKVLQHDFFHLPSGEQYQASQHEYSSDLDIFGKASLYQYVNRTSSEQGNQLLANWLSHPAPPPVILYRQEAVEELSGIARWRQQFESLGFKNKLSYQAEHAIESWLAKQTSFIQKPAWKFLQVLLPLAGMSLLGLHISGILAASPFYMLVLLFLVISLLISKKVMPEYLQLNKIAPEITTLYTTIAHVEDVDFKAELLKIHKTDFESKNQKASVTVKKLKSILDRMDYRLNPLVFIPLNTFLFWDLHQVMALEKWKETNRQGISKWFHSIAALEALSSLANLRFNNPTWIFPRIVTGKGLFNSEDLGHPLIPSGKRVTSNFSTTQKGTINLVTGSNMAGKSTFLRAVGINIVLAMAGGPVCATKLELSPMKVMSSMRVSDNLEESTSTFYAELKKLKQIIEAVNRNEDVILLLDEILRGTNSADRHTGSAALIRQLLRHDAVGIVATHDLALASLEKEFPGQLKNYHFDVQVEGEELFFDYILKEGVCTSMNASLLMKKIGIEIKE